MTRFGHAFPAGVRVWLATGHTDMGRGFDGLALLVQEQLKRDPTYVRDDRPFAGTAAPAAAFFYSPDRRGAHPHAHLATYAGLMQADAYAAFNRLYEPGRKPGPITEAMCWAHARRKLFDVARLNKAPIAMEAVKRIDALFEIERDINGKPPSERQRVRAERSRPLVAELKMWLQAQRAKLSAHSDTAKAIADGEELLRARRLSLLQREAIEVDLKRYRKVMQTRLELDEQ